MDPNHAPRQPVNDQDLVYLLVVNGKIGALLPKLVVKWDWNGAAQALMKAVQDGFSVAFSGSALRSQWEMWAHNLNPNKSSLMRVESLGALEDVGLHVVMSNKNMASYRDCLRILR